MKNKYRTVIEIKDWGAVITKVIIELDKPVPVNSISKDTFEVFVSKSDKRLADPFLQAGYRTVTKAFVSDQDGNRKKNGSGKYAVLEMGIGPKPDNSLGNALNYQISTGYNDWVDYQYTITQVKDIQTHACTLSGIVINQLAGEIKELVDDFSTGTFTYQDQTLTYADFAPKKDKADHPLIVWLHGAGEGGTDPTLPLSANKAVSFATDETQAYFDEAYVLVPQTPTFWMDGEVGFADGTSIYEESLMALIRDYVAKHPDIDPNRIYVGGASNGGYMTMLLIRDYPRYFAAAFPVCEGLNDDLISDDDIFNMIKTPTWFVAAANDPILPPAENVIPTYERMIQAGGQNIQLSLFDNVVDTSGLYNNPDGIPCEYNGHFSWTYLFNNVPKTTITGKATTIMEWLANQ
ncbi:prolyl oligopeptidase family serine peptidase [Aquibacillus sp. 3ASR75-54]|uniref:Prolyl oligopeptidase family serine peptidase n=1 Tax=Aquibacillus salsiterrae TaxID=2950439 RepID=A0A9X3WG30_9BACI|nr:prolyl oligopeptidase family serine peptidase [Aquibacillus salsiterrae]MDC3418363.1 prolyl oligopeptidase family serine peptidase [Aquibacillus salsiterrae]